MPERTEHHVALHFVRPPEERDTWDAMPGEVKASWRNALLGDEQIDEPNEKGNYFVRLTNEERRVFEAVQNVAYAVAVEEVHAHGDPGAVEVVAENVNPILEHEYEAAGLTSALDFAFPDPATMVFHNAKGTEKNARAGKGYLVWHLDDGVSKVMEDMTPGGVVFRKNYVGGSGTDNPNGHGSMTCSLAVSNGAALAVCKVLGDNGSGSSAGITAAIRDAAKYAREHPGMEGKIVLTGSLGGAPGRVYQPYVDACEEAEDAGVLCLWSAGNDGQHAISAPANWRDDRASIAFDRPSDRRASFSNYHASAALAAEGQNILMIDRHGWLVRGNGTSFSLPITTRHIVVGAWMRSASVFRVFRSMLANARDSAESVDEEAHGVINLWKAINKLPKAPGGEEPPSTDVWHRVTVEDEQVSARRQEQGAKDLVASLKKLGVTSAKYTTSK